MEPRVYEVEPHVYAVQSHVYAVEVVWNLMFMQWNLTFMITVRQCVSTKITSILDQIIAENILRIKLFRGSVCILHMMHLSGMYKLPIARKNPVMMEPTRAVFPCPVWK